MKSYVSPIITAIARLMEGSLFFRGLVAILDFIKKLIANSFVGRIFVGDLKPLEESLSRSKFVFVLDKLLNSFKPLTPPTNWPTWLSNLTSGSFFIGKTLETLNIPIPPPGTAKQVGNLPIIRLGLFAFPAVGVAAVVFLAPFLPTMVLAGLVIPILLLTFLSRKFIFDPTAVLLLVFILVSFFAAVLSLTPVSSLQIVLLTSVFMLSTMLVVACATTTLSVDFLIKVFIVAAGLTGIVGFYQVIAGFQGNMWLDQDLFAGDSRIVSTFGNPNVYGTYLLLAIPLAAASIVYFKGIFTKLCATGITVLLVANLGLTLSRGCYLSLALAVAVFVLIMEKRLVVMLVPAVVALPFILPQNILNRIVSIVNFQDTSTAFRLNIWRGSIRVIQDFWLGGIGQGIDAYNSVYPFYALTAIYSPHAHSLYFQYLIEVGIFGFLIFIIMLAFFFRTMAQFLRHTKNIAHKIMAAAMVSAVIGFLFQGLTDYVFYNYRVLLSFYIFIGICIAFARVNKPSEIQND